MESVSQSVSQEAGRQVLHADMFLIVEVLPLGSSRSRARHTHQHTHTRTHTHTQQHHTSSAVIPRQREKEEEERESIYLFRKETLGEIFSYFDGYTPHEYFLFFIVPLQTKQH